MATSNEIISAKLDELQKAINDVVIQTSKGIKDSSKDAKGIQPAAGPSLDTKIESATIDFNSALDAIEAEIVKAKSVLLRDLNERRAKRMPPPLAAPVTAAEPKPVAPPAPMTVDIESPVADTASLSGPTAGAPQSSFPGAPRPFKQESRPPAPVPDMGFDLSVSPEVRPSPSPALSHAKAKQIRSSPKTSPKPTAAQMAAMAARPGSAPPKKEPKATPPSHTSRTAGSTPLPPAPAPSAPVAPPAPMMADPVSLAPPVAPSAAPAAPAQTQGPAPQPEMVFTDMTFSLAPAANELSHAGGQMDMQAPAQQHNAADANMLDMTQFGSPADVTGGLNMSNFDTGMMDLTAGGMNATDNNNLMADSDHHNAAVDMSNVDAEIENLLNSAGPNSSEKMDMDYDLGNIGLDNNSFDEMYFGTGSGGDEEFTQDTYDGF
ncbi:hypothetical protein CONLIGDRAFT_640810 [Coniochaeta ligniaria NRRL 30616]|uniref:Uncharacterized protein n=1 Tax=Coniochaeta ligniaria NRRL 30616 TaxID=1408157 RepID=A0A1J7JUJ4_9PEZI|nr:hypothetical protein CONLIGDRAFT_640810 [Coniochaeta ligniaria NRRL 30616]